MDTIQEISSRIQQLEAELEFENLQWPTMVTPHRIPPTNENRFSRSQSDLHNMNYVTCDNTGDHHVSLPQLHSPFRPLPDASRRTSQTLRPSSPQQPKVNQTNFQTPMLSSTQNVVPSQDQILHQVVASQTAIRDFAASTNLLLQRFTERSELSQVERRIPPFVHYSGTLEEDPYKFITAINRYFTEHKILNDAERVHIARKQLTGDAKRWIDSYNHNTDFTFPNFITLMLQKFDSPDCNAAANISFFASHQNQKETVEVFLMKKRQLMERLSPNISEPTAIGIMITLIKPEVGNILRATRPETFEELLSSAIRVESGFSQQNTSNVSTPRTVNQNTHSNTNTQQNISRNANVPHTNTTNPSPSGPNNNRERVSGRRMPEYPCKYCQAWHFHNECPRNPNLQPGNARRPDGNQAPPPARQPPVQTQTQGQTAATSSRTPNNH